VSQDVVYIGADDLGPSSQARMVTEKLKSWTALSNFPTTTAVAGIYVFEN
jgi:hypothetical protein